MDISLMVISLPKLLSATLVPLKLFSLSLFFGLIIGLLFAILRLNKEQGYTFCMIEHDMEFISRLCNPVIVMAEGSVLFEGTSDEVKKNEKVIESYLGKGSKLKDKA